MIYNPLIVFDIGFQYSGLVTFGLIVSTKYYKKNYFYNLFITSFIALLFSVPITLYNNYELNCVKAVRKKEDLLYMQNGIMNSVYVYDVYNS